MDALKTISTLLEPFVPFLTVVGTLAGVLFGLWRFNKTQDHVRKNLQIQSELVQSQTRLVHSQDELLRHEREAKAIELFIKFNDLAASVAGEQVEDNEGPVFWRYNSMLAITESLYKVGSEDWKQTVTWNLSQLAPLFDKHAIHDRTYTKEFIDLVKQTFPKARFRQPG